MGSRKELLFGLAGLVMAFLFTACNSKESHDVGSAELPQQCIPDGGSGTPPSSTLTYDGQIKPIIDAKCVHCHNGGTLFSLATYEAVKERAVESLGEIKAGSMPADGKLPADEYDKLVTWLSTPGLPKNDGSTTIAAVCPTPTPTPTPPPCEGSQGGHAHSGCQPEPELPRVDLTVSFPKHTIVPDENGDEMFNLTALVSTGTPKLDPNKTYYIVGSEVEARDTKGKLHPALHHLLVLNGNFMTSSTGGFARRSLKDLLGGSIDSLIYKALSLWGGGVPGQSMSIVPAGYGMRFQEPGKDAKLLLNIHCNTKMAPKDVDKDIYLTVKFMLEEQVSHVFYSPLIVNPEWLKGNMLIPANNPYVSHEYKFDPFLWTGTQKTKLDLFGVGYHMHALAVGGSYHQITTTNNVETQTLFHMIMDFNYANQIMYPFTPARRIIAGEKLKLTCYWDNSQANQQYVDGVQLTSADVNWGESTFDEMCMSPIGFGEVD